MTIVMFEHRCIICKRKLTNPKSIERRMGDICHKKYLAGYRGIQTTINTN